MYCFITLILVSINSLPLCLAGRSGEYIYSGDQINFKSGKTLSISCTDVVCHQKSYPRSTWQGSGLEKEFRITERKFNDTTQPIRSGDRVSFHQLYSDKSLCCVSDGPCKLHNNQNCLNKEFSIYAPNAIGECRDVLHFGCRGEPIQYHDLIFLWHHGSTDDNKYFVGKQSDGTISAHSQCPGHFFDIDDVIKKCRSDSWQINKSHFH